MSNWRSVTQNRKEALLHKYIGYLDRGYAMMKTTLEQSRRLDLVGFVDTQHTLVLSNIRSFITNLARAKAGDETTSSQILRTPDGKSFFDESVDSDEG